MSDNQTRPTNVAVEAFLSSVPDERKRADAFVLHQMMEEITGQPGTMWGPAIVGYGSYHYVYESGREGDAPIVGFSPRKSAFSLYLMGGWEGQAGRIERLGKYTNGKGCIYFKRLSDIDESVLREMIVDSFFRLGAEEAKKHC